MNKSILVLAINAVIIFVMMIISVGVMIKWRKNEAKAEKETKKRAEKAKGRAAGGKKSASTGKASWARRKFGKKK